MNGFIALIRKGDGADFGVDFPDFPGCVTAGVDLDEAKDMAQEALALHIEGMREDGQRLPAPSPLEAVMADPRNQDAVAFLVPAPTAREKVVRVNVSFPESVLSRIDAAARARAVSRSQYLQDAALAEIGERGR